MYHNRAENPQAVDGPDVLVQVLVKQEGVWIVRPVLQKGEFNGGQIYLLAFPEDAAVGDIHGKGAEDSLAVSLFLLRAAYHGVHPRQ